MRVTLKDKVLKVLEESKGEPVSGEMLAQSLGVSRAAIWKAIDSLRKSGCNINASSKVGYSLSKKNNYLSKEGILNSLNHLSQAQPNGESVLVFETIDSTNKEAIRLLSNDSLSNTGVFPKNNFGLKAAVIANEQTNGRGRLGRDFESPKDTGLYISLIVTPTFNIESATLVTTMVSVMLTRVFKDMTKAETSIKWVNDIYIQDKKITGILTEGVTNFETGEIDHIIIGIGVNCFTKEFTDKAGNNPGSLSTEIFSRNELAARIILAVNDLLESMVSFNMVTPSRLQEDMLNEYKSKSMILGKKITILNTKKIATAVDISTTGGIVVQYEDGSTEIISSGEVSIRLA